MSTTTDLPQVESRPDEYDLVRFMLLRGDPPSGADVIGGKVWMLVYRAVYGHGYHDGIARVRLVVAADRDQAVSMLQWLEYGFSERIILYNVAPLFEVA